MKNLQAFNRESRKCIYIEDSTFPHEKLQQLVCTCASHQRSVLHLGRTTLKLVSSYVDPTSVAVFVIGASFFRKQWNIGPEHSVRYLELDFCKCCCNLQTVARPFFEDQNFAHKKNLKKCCKKMLPDQREVATQKSAPAPKSPKPCLLKSQSAGSASPSLRFCVGDI